MAELPHTAPHAGAIAPELRLLAAHPALRDAWTHDKKLEEARERGAAPEVQMPEALRREPFLAEVQPGADLTADWFTEHVGKIYEGLQASGQSFNRYLEIGCFEGLSTIWFGRYLAQQTAQPRITVVDGFWTLKDHGNYEPRFDHNVRTFLAGVPLRKIKAPSNQGLAALVRNRAAFDLIYVDGSHEALDVMVDACLSWKLLRPGGVILFDDYFWTHDHMAKSTLEGLNAFLDAVKGEYKVLKVYWQVMLQKVATAGPAR